MQDYASPKRTASRWAAFLLAVSTLIGSAAQARTDVCYQGGLNLPNFKLNGSATLNGTDLLVTPNEGNKLGSAMFVPTFAATSDIHIQLKLQITTTVGGGADGIAFVMHRDPRGAAALGDPARAIGYGGTNKITPSVTVEMDTYTNSGDPNDNHLGVTLDGDPTTHIASYIPTFRMKTVGTPFYVWVDYLAATTTLTVYVSQTATKPLLPQMTTVVNLAQRFGNQPFYMGFTGSTGGELSQHEILSFIASDTAATSGVCCSNNADCTGSQLGPVCDTVKNVCSQCTPTQLGACTMPNPGCDIGGASNTCISGCKSNYGSGMAGACPSASAPFCIPSGPTAGSCTACDGNFGSGSGLSCPQGAPSCNATGFCGLCTKNSDCTATCTVSTKTCAPCKGDQGSGVSNACTDTAAPLCDSLGGCRKCIADTDCATGTHAGPFCNPTTGSCGTTCLTDAQCGSGKFCNTQSGSCDQLVTTGQPLPSGSTCTAETGARVCQSQVCSTTSNQCVECAADTDCKTAGQVCQSFVCKTPDPATEKYTLAGGGLGGSCSFGGGHSGNAGALCLFATAALWMVGARRRRRAGRSQ